MSRPQYISRKQELPLKGDSTSIFLQVIISISVFIFAITLSGVLSINTMLYNWNQSILGSLTVQIMPINDVNKERATAQTLAHQDKAIELLQTVKGIIKVTPLSNEQLKELIQPWLGDGVNINNLPIPRIIDVKLAADAEIDFADLAQKLAQASPQASLDNHKLWLSKLIDFADGLKLIASTVLILVILITSGAIFYTTQMSLGLHRHIIEAWLGFCGGLFGMLLAIPTIFFIGSLAVRIEGGIISDATLGLVDWGIIFSLPIFSMLIAMYTAYYTVKRTLQKML